MNEKEIQERIRAGRDFMRPAVWDEDYMTDQEMKKPQPPLVKETAGREIISLPRNLEDLPLEGNFLQIVNRRQSHRVYTQDFMTLLQLSFLLWTTQGIKEIRGKRYATLRTVPCGGARHEFETYLFIRRVEGVKPGYYQYLPMTHQLALLEEEENGEAFITESLEGQEWAAKASVIFYWSVVPYRAEWRYGMYAHRVALIDAGYISQNLYLACTALGLGGCAVGSLDEKLCNKAFGLDGSEEFMILAHPVGSVSEADLQAEKDFYAFLKEQDL
ncbi:MAG: SagB/ThcOx family dehydrogenase [Solobacterium sp.]|nr:SagB/ThcOx family dehydrogenase [Solobacterium sp.]